MSCIFEDETGETIWSPGLESGQLFVSLIEATSNQLEVPHGIKAVASDFFQVLADPHTTFTVELLTRMSKSIYREQLGGLCRISIGLLSRSKITVPTRSSLESMFLEDGIRLAAGWPV